MVDGGGLGPGAQPQLADQALQASSPRPGGRWGNWILAVLSTAFGCLFCLILTPSRISNFDSFRLFLVSPTPNFPKRAGARSIRARVGACRARDGARGAPHHNTTTPPHLHPSYRFVNDLAITDPLQTLYQLMSSRKPSAMNQCADQRWGSTAPLHHCATAPLHHAPCTMHHAALHHCTSAPLHFCTTAPLHHCTTATLHHVPLHHCTTAPLLHCSTAPLQHCTMHHCTIAPLHHCTHAPCTR